MREAWTYFADLPGFTWIYSDLIGLEPPGPRRRDTRRFPKTAPGSRNANTSLENRPLQHSPTPICPDLLRLGPIHPDCAPPTPIHERVRARAGCASHRDFKMSKNMLPPPRSRPFALPGSSPESQTYRPRRVSDQWSWMQEIHTFHTDVNRKIMPPRHQR